MVFLHRLSSLAANLLPGIERVFMVLVCWQLAGLAWGIFAPSTAGPMLTPPRPTPIQKESRDALLGWFGGGETETTTQTADGYTLTAVIAAQDGGVAVFRDDDGKSFAVRTGEAIDATSRLLSVTPEHATVERDHARRTLFLPQSEPAAADAESAAPLAKSPSIRLSRGRMAGTMQNGNVANWDSGLSSAPDGGIRIDRAPPFAGLLQLQNGDVLRTINQRPLARLADISRVAFHFTRDAAVELEIIRHGASLTLHYDIQP
jgi:hypothetical protein